MNATELRWGNLVQSKVSFEEYPNLLPHFPSYIAVSPIEIMDCHRNKENWTYEPIPVNDDTLISILKFEEVDNGYDEYEKEDENLPLERHFKRNRIKIIKINEEYYMFNVKVEFIHKIQNLWFEHTNTELIELF